MGRGSTLAIEGCRITRVDVGKAVQQRLVELLKLPKDQVAVLGDLFSAVMVTGCTFTTEQNQFAFQDANLDANVFDIPWHFVPPTHVETPVAGRMIGRSAVFTGNRSALPANIVNLAFPDSSVSAANLWLTLV